jgi:DNA-directed RNA polymerase delta subunit
MSHDTKKTGVRFIVLGTKKWKMKEYYEIMLWQNGKIC